MKKALVIEDYSSLSELYKTAFSRANIQVDAVARAEDGLEKLKSNSYDVLLVDLLLQEMSGLEFLKALEGPKKYPAMKIYVVTNLTNPELATEVIKLGAKKYFVKAEHTPKEVVENITNDL